MQPGRLKILQAEVENQLQEIGRVYEALDQRRTAIDSDVAYRESAAYQLHSLYCAIEDLLKIVAAEFENRIEDHDRYHIALLRRMKLRIDGVRPQLISEETFRCLDELRSFRHYFRHSYGRLLEAGKLQAPLAAADAVRERLPAEANRFLLALSTEAE